MNKEEKERNITTYEKYPSWCKDEVDRIISDIIVKSKASLTFTQIKNKVYERLFLNVNKEPLTSKLSKLRERGILDKVSKETTIEVWEVKELKDEKYPEWCKR